MKRAKDYIFGPQPEDKRQDRRPATASASSHASGTASTSAPARAAPTPSPPPPRGFKRTVQQARTVHARGDSKRHEPVLQDTEPGMPDGGVQSLHWFASKQRQDEDGCIADGFYVESGAKMLPKRVWSRPKPALVQVRAVDGGNVIFAR